MAVATLTNRAFDDARRSPQIGDGEKLNGERGECHIEHEALVLKVWQETVPNWEKVILWRKGKGEAFAFYPPK